MENISEKHIKTGLAEIMIHL